MMPLDRSDQVDDLVRSNRAHDAELERALLEAGEIPGQALRLMRLVVDLLEMRFHHRAELGKMRVRPLAMEQQPAELLLQQLDCARQRRLRDVALLGGLGEVQRICDGQEIADLVHLHSDPLSTR